MDLGQREVPEGEPDPAAQRALDAFDLSKCLPRVRALVVAVLDDQPTAATADVIHRLVEGPDGHAHAH
jgi:hypothetical protein